MRAMRAVPIQHSALHSSEVSRARLQVPARGPRMKRARTGSARTDVALRYWAASQFNETQRSQTPFIPAHSASLRAFTPVFDGLWTRVNALMLGIQGQGLGPRNGVPATLASRGAPRGDKRERECLGRSLADVSFSDRSQSHSNALLENPRLASAFTNSVLSSNCISLAIVSSAEACSPAM